MTGQRAESGCSGHARFDSAKQAWHVAESLTVEFETVWTAVVHGEHWHVIDTGVAAESPPPDEGVVCVI